uniref:Uncharacterized protein n=1 Tax=Oryza glumipatula TaxID=40148 RepID=A0A0E0A7X8_9ORYZ
MASSTKIPFLLAVLLLLSVAFPADGGDGARGRRASWRVLRRMRTEWRALSSRESKSMKGRKEVEWTKWQRLR